MSVLQRCTSDTAAVNTPKEYLFKVLVIGEFGVGKTSIIRRYTEGYFSPNYKLTIGVDFALKTLDWESDTKINLQLWDIAGHERFGHMTRVYYKYAVAAIIVFDLTRPATQDAAIKWLEDVRDKVMLSDEEPIPVMLLANKCDMEGIEVDTEYLNTFCREQNFIAWFPTSAKDNINIDESMNFLLSKIISMTTSSQGASQMEATAGSQLETIVLDDDSDDERERRKDKCC